LSILIAVGAGVALIITMLPILNAHAWWVRVLDFPRVQFAVYSLIGLMLSLFFGDLTLTSDALSALAFAACFLYQCSWIYPYTVFSECEVKKAKNTNGDNRISLLCANVLMTNRESKKLLKIISDIDPDVIVTLETDSWWESELSDLESSYSYTIKCPLDNLYGMHVYSKLKLSDEKIEFLVEDDVPSMHCFIELRNGRTCQTHFMHPSPPVPNFKESSAERDAELIALAKAISPATQPVIVAGDLNDVAWSKTTRLFRKISGLIDLRIGRGFFNTFHADYPILRWPLDHIFCSTHFKVSQVQRMPPFGSDHFAFFTELVLTENESASDRQVAADAEDRRLANEKIAEENISSRDIPFSNT